MLTVSSTQNGAGKPKMNLDDDLQCTVPNSVCMAEFEGCNMHLSLANLKLFSFRAGNHTSLCTTPLWITGAENSSIQLAHKYKLSRALGYRIHPSPAVPPLELRLWMPFRKFHKLRSQPSYFRMSRMKMN